MAVSVLVLLLITAAAEFEDSAAAAAGAAVGGDAAAAAPGCCFLTDAVAVDSPGNALLLTPALSAAWLLLRLLLWGYEAKAPPAREDAGSYRNVVEYDGT